MNIRLEKTRINIYILFELVLLTSVEVDGGIFDSIIKQSLWELSASLSSSVDFFGINCKFSLL
jgi:hypothetical protein